MERELCIKCGTQLRPGSSFCGSCGASTAESHHEFDSASSDLPLLSCPNCGKPIRSEAYYCNYCGEPIRSEAEPANQKNDVFAGDSTPPPHFSKSRTTIPPGLIGVMVLLFLVIIGTTWGIWVKFGTGIIPASSETAIALAIKSAVDGTATQKAAKIPTETDPIIDKTTTAISEYGVSVPTEPTLSATVIENTEKNPVPIMSLTVDATNNLNAIQSTISPLPSLTPNTVNSILLDDSFGGTLNTNWEVWGEPRPIIRTGFNDLWLDLKAADKLGRAGVTSRIEIPNIQGVSIEFDAQLNSTYPQFPILFDWDPSYFKRGTENTEPTILHMEIRQGQIILLAPAAQDSCLYPSDGRKKHTYRLSFTETDKIRLTIDSHDPAVCDLEYGFESTVGRISFTGNGWISRVQVSAPIN